MVSRLPRPDPLFTFPPRVCSPHYTPRETQIGIHAVTLSPLADIPPMLTNSEDTFVFYNPIVPTSGISYAESSCSHHSTPLATIIYPNPISSPPYLLERSPSDRRHQTRSSLSSEPLLVGKVVWLRHRLQQC